MNGTPTVCDALARIHRLKVKQNKVLAVKVFNLLKIMCLNQIIVANGLRLILEGI